MQVAGARTHTARVLHQQQQSLRLCAGAAQQWWKWLPSVRHKLSCSVSCKAVGDKQPSKSPGTLHTSLRGKKHTFGIFVSSGSPAAAEAISFSGVDWVCIDTQHGAVGYAELAHLIRAVALGRARSIVRVGGPDDRYGIQQALE